MADPRTCSTTMTRPSGVDHQAIWADGAVNDVGHLVSPRSRGVNELANDAGGRRKIDGHRALFRARQ